MVNRLCNRFYLAAMIFGCLIGSIPAQTPSPVDMDRATFPARGTQETLIHISSPGRYSLTATSEQGTALEIVDRMAGPLGRAGTTGSADGRLDLLLDKGEYKVRLFAPPEGTGTVTLKIRPFTEVDGKSNVLEHPLLTPLEVTSTHLEDLQQCSFWITIHRNSVFRLEIQGRALTDARLWRDGSRLEDISADVSQHEPVTGHPMTNLDFHGRLTPGHYLVTCYGGQPLPWTDGSPENPLYVRWGVRGLGENGQVLLTVSPFGRETFLVKGSTNFFQLAREKISPATLQVRPWSSDRGRYGEGESAEIVKESRDPWCVIYGSAGTDQQWVVVTAPPGDRLELDFFRQATRHTLSRDMASYWISSVHSSTVRDALDVTAILSRWDLKTPVAAQVVKIGPDTPVVRRINLLGTTQVFLFVEKEGAYMIAEDPEAGATGSYQIKPFMMRPPYNFQPPPFQSAGSRHELTAGYHVLTVNPNAEGTLHFALFAVVAGEDPLVSGRKLLNDAALANRQHPFHGLLWPEVSMTSGQGDYELWLNQLPFVASGFIVRPLPLDLSDPVAMTLMPGRSVPVRIRLDAPGILEVIGAGDYRVTLNGRTLAADEILPRGVHTLTMTNTGSGDRLFNLRTHPPRDESPTTPAFKPAADVFPTLSPGTPIYEHFTRHARREYSLNVTEPGLYRVETTGRLATRLTLRTPLSTSLISGDRNGVGRNGLIQMYLKPGEYLVSAETRGNSAGQAGILAHRIDLLTLPALQPDTIRRHTVPADAALRYPVEIPTAGDYRLETLGLAAAFAWRLDDTDGWPILAPGGKGPIQRHFEPGTYWFYSLPAPVESRRITTLRRIPVPLTAAQRSGKGPLALALNSPLEKIWMELPERPPDVFTTTLNAPARVTLTLSPKSGMIAAIFTPDGRELHRTADEKWSGTLPAGSFEIHAWSREKNNRVTYTIALTTPDLIPGLTRTITAFPTTLDVNVEREGLVDIFSFGRADLSARLLDSATGEVLAADDDMPSDWNFRITRRLPPGRFKLELTGSGSLSSPAEVTMQQRTDRRVTEQTLPLSLTASPNGDVLHIPFTAPSAENLVRFGRTGDIPLRLALRRGDTLLAEGDNELIVPLKPGATYELSAWQTGTVPGATTITGAPMMARDLRFADHPLTVAMTDAIRLVDASRTAFRLESDQGRVLYSPGIERPCLPVGNTAETTVAGTGWMVCPEAGTVRITPFKIMSNSESSLTLTDLPLDFHVDQPADEAIVLSLESVRSWVGATAAAGSPGPGMATHWNGCGLSPSLTLLGFPGQGHYRSRVWPGHPTAAIHSAEESDRLSQPVTIRSTALVILENTRLPLTTPLERRLPAGRAIRYHLPSEPLDLELTLDKGMVAFVWDHDRPVDLVSATEGIALRRMHVPGGVLIVGNPTSAETLFRARRADHPAPAAQVLKTDSPIEAVYPSPGRFRVLVPGDLAGHRIVTTAMAGYLLAADGRILTGRFLAGPLPMLAYPAVKGELVVEHGPGPVRVWISPDGQAAETFVGLPSRPAQPTSLPGNLELQDAPQSWEFDLGESRLVSITTASPGVTALAMGDRILTLAVGDRITGREIGGYLEPGHYRIITRPLRGTPQSGRMHITALSIQTLPEGGAGWRLINPDETQAFRFEVTVAGKVGIGLATSSDRLTARLLDMSYREVDTGPLMIRELDPGAYILLVKGGKVPIRFRPIVLGTNGSRTGIPDDVIRRYIKEEK